MQAAAAAGISSPLHPTAAGQQQGRRPPKQSWWGVLEPGCLWCLQEAAAAQGQVRGFSQRRYPGLCRSVLSLPTTHKHCPHCCLLTGEFHLTLQRLVLAGVKLAPADGGAAPALWPSGLFDSVGTGLNMSDVRLVVDAADFSQYLALMQSLPRSVAQYYTDAKSFLHIAAWQGRKVSAHSVTGRPGRTDATRAA